MINFEIYFVVCCIVLLYTLFKDKGQLSIKWSSVATFVGFITVVTMFRICLYDTYMITINELHKFPIKMSNFLWVGLEDVFFSMTPYYLTKKINKKPINLIIWVGFSLLFASGHLYQGLFVAAITGLYPYFISRKYAMKTTYATVMICHFLYDCFTFLTIKIAFILQHL